MDIGSGCGDAALAVVKAMPAWNPGHQKGRPVKVKLNLPIQFSLRNAELALAERFTITWGDIVGDTVTIEQLKRNLPFSVYVRGPEGDSRYVDELSFTYTTRSNRKSTAASRGGISDELVAIVEKTRSGGQFHHHSFRARRWSIYFASRTFQFRLKLNEPTLPSGFIRKITICKMKNKINPSIYLCRMNKVEIRHFTNNWHYSFENK
ncbi:MAG: hypothetical protein IPM82_03885 [Saprospiraceae bacterium]|nr:hypothetical protein [Saprospiraceae bacterium]